MIQKLAIISSVPEWWFASLVENPEFGFNDQERSSALKTEEQVFIDAIWIDWLSRKVQIEVIRAMDGIPPSYSADAYILGWSPSMVTDKEKYEWIDRLVKFVHAEVNKWKPLFWICFWHQILATAFWWTVKYMPSRRIGSDFIKDEVGNSFYSIWSHKQAVYDSWEAVSGIIRSHSDIIETIQVGDNAYGTQFHPEFSPQFTSFLVKLMREQLISEWLDPDKIIDNLYQGAPKNTSSILLRWFIKKYYNL